MGTVGPTFGSPTGRLMQVTTNGDLEPKTGGATIDWATVTTVGPATLADGVVVATGDKYIVLGTIMVRITASGKTGPASTTAADGRQTLTRGNCWFLNQTVLQSEPKSDFAAHYEGGSVFMDLMQTNENFAGVNNPTEANVLAALPRLRPQRTNT